MRVMSDRAFNAYGVQMRAATEFKYLGRVLTNTDDDWPAVAGNIRKARADWGRLARILGREGANPKVSRSFYTSVTQQVLLFGEESWVLTNNIESALDAFLGRVARRLTGRQPCRGRDGKWFYPSLTGDLKEGGVMRARTLVLWRHNTVAQFISTLPILRLCEVAERRRGEMCPPAVVGSVGNRLESGEGKGGSGSSSGGSKRGRVGDTGIGSRSGIGIGTSPHAGVDRGLRIYR